MITNSATEDTPDPLNSTDHFAYIIGRTDGLVHPLDDIPRSEAITIFFRLLKDSVRDGNLKTTNAYSDVKSGAWYNTAISTMTGLGITKGYIDGTYQPQGSITRAEFATMAARFSNSAYDGDDMFTDIAGHWAQYDINRAAAAGWIQGYNSEFRPDDYITRAEVMALVNRMVNRIPESESDLHENMTKWPDNSPSAWYYIAVQEATNSHDYTRKVNGYEKWSTMRDIEDWKKYER